MREYIVIGHSAHTASHYKVDRRAYFSTIASLIQQFLHIQSLKLTEMCHIKLVFWPTHTNFLACLHICSMELIKMHENLIFSQCDMSELRWQRFPLVKIITFFSLLTTTPMQCHILSPGQYQQHWILCMWEIFDTDWAIQT